MFVLLKTPDYEEDIPDIEIPRIVISASTMQVSFLRNLALASFVINFSKPQFQNGVLNQYLPTKQNKTKKDWFTPN